MLSYKKVALLVMALGLLACDGDGPRERRDDPAGGGAARSDLGAGGSKVNGTGHNAGGSGSGGAGGQVPSCFSGIACADYGECQPGMECNLALGQCQPHNCAPDGTPCSHVQVCASNNCDGDVCRACDCTAVCEAKAECFTGHEDVARCVKACDDRGGTIDPCFCPNLGHPWCTDILKCMGG